ncbi:MAG: class I SAM-dependent methyltransferase [Candidatus Cloacimonetes bacterium]|nr:class I SAM-dependent methyltransferase [Candidatus Cloacimonadota bacterium]
MDGLKEARCIVCGNDDTAKMNIKYFLEQCVVVECGICGFNFIPPYYREKIEYRKYKSNAVYKEVQKGNEWLKIQRNLLKFKAIRKYKKHGSILDIGSGWGHFLLTGKQLGYKVKGVELSETGYQYSTEVLELPALNIDFMEMDETEKYDIITMWDVLEHMDNADEILKKCRRILNPNGYIFIHVPQIDSLLARLFDDKWIGMGLDHVNYFSKPTITRILEQNGFRVKSILSSLEMKVYLMYFVLPLLQKKKLRSYISPAERQQFFNKVTSKAPWKLKLFVFVHNLLYTLLSKLHIGDEMLVIAKKVR